MPPLPLPPRPRAAQPAPTPARCPRPRPHACSHPMCARQGARLAGAQPGRVPAGAAWLAAVPQEDCQPAAGEGFLPGGWVHGSWGAASPRWGAGRGLWWGRARACNASLARTSPGMPPSLPSLPLPPTGLSEFSWKINALGNKQVLSMVSPANVILSVCPPPRYDDTGEGQGWGARASAPLPSTDGPQQSSHPSCTWPIPSVCAYTYYLDTPGYLPTVCYNNKCWGQVRPRAGRKCAQRASKKLLALISGRRAGGQWRCRQPTTAAQKRASLPCLPPLPCLASPQRRLHRHLPPVHHPPLHRSERDAHADHPLSAGRWVWRQCRRMRGAAVGCLHGRCSGAWPDARASPPAALQAESSRRRSARCLPRSLSAHHPAPAPIFSPDLSPAFSCRALSQAPTPLHNWLPSTFACISCFTASYTTHGWRRKGGQRLGRWWCGRGV